MVADPTPDPTPEPASDPRNVIKTSPAGRPPTWEEVRADFADFTKMAQENLDTPGHTGMFAVCYVGCIMEGGDLRTDIWAAGIGLNDQHMRGIRHLPEVARRKLQTYLIAASLLDQIEGK